MMARAVITALLLSGLPLSGFAQPGASLLPKADGNNDGSVSREEFLQARSQLFTVVDADASESLSEDEFGRAIEGTPMSRFVGRVFRRTDTNKNGSVELTEWDALPTRAFDRLDRDRNGILDAKEIEAAAAARR